MKKLFGLLALGFLASPTLTIRAAVVVSGNVTTTGGTFSINQDIDLSITTDGDVYALIFDEWVANDATLTPLNFSAATLQYQINSGPIQGVILNNLDDNFVGTANQVTANDGLIFFGPISVTIGDTLTLKAGSWAIPGNAAFNPQTLQSFVGPVFATDQNGFQLSSVTVVPESHEYGILAGAGLLGLAIWRRRKITLAR